MRSTAMSYPSLVFLPLTEYLPVSETAAPSTTVSSSPLAATLPAASSRTAVRLAASDPGIVFPLCGEPFHWRAISPVAQSTRGRQFLLDRRPFLLSRAKFAFRRPC